LYKGPLAYYWFIKCFVQPGLSIIVYHVNPWFNISGSSSYTKNEGLSVTTRKFHFSREKSFFDWYQWAISSLLILFKNKVCPIVAYGDNVHMDLPRLIFYDKKVMKVHAKIMKRNSIIPHFFKISSKHHSIIKYYSCSQSRL